MAPLPYYNLLVLGDMGYTRWQEFNNTLGQNLNTNHGLPVKIRYTEISTESPYL